MIQVRFQTPHGQIRINVDESTTISNVFQELESKLKLEKGSDIHLVLNTDQKLSLSLSECLSEKLSSPFLEWDHAPNEIVYVTIIGKSELDKEQIRISQLKHDERFKRLQEDNIIPLRAQMNKLISIYRQDFKSGHYFQNYVRNIENWRVQRLGWIFGEKNQISKGMPVNYEDSIEERYIDKTIYPQWVLNSSFIYEPEQIFDYKTNKISISKNDLNGKLIHAETISRALNYERIGLIFSTGFRKNNNSLNSLEVIRAAKLQKIYGDHFITVVCSPTESGDAQFEAYQISTQGMDLINSGIAVSHPNDEYKLSTIIPIDKLRVETNEINVSDLILRIRVEMSNSILESTSFPIENRDNQLQTLETLKNQLLKYRDENIKFFRDPHILIYLLENNLIDESILSIIFDNIKEGISRNSYHSDSLVSIFQTIASITR